MPDEASLVAELRRSPLVSADTLIRAVGIGSQATFSRLVTRAGDRIVAVGRARARRYAAARDIAGLGRAVPVYRIDAAGAMDRVAVLRPYAPAGTFVDDPARLPRWMRGARGNGTCDGWPVFLRDARPQGFLGLAFAARHAADLELPADPSRWSDDDTLVALARGGTDVAGDLVVGDEAAKRVYEAWAQGARAIDPDDRPRAYADLAREAIDGIAPGAVVGGDQRKFGATVNDRGVVRHVLVKFSPSEYSASARRWCDLLVCEHLAAEHLRRHGIAAVASGIVEGGSRVFLETTRFDRVGERGRRAVVTLAALGAEYLGAPPPDGEWSGAIERLERDRWLERGITSRVRVVEAFGRFIANAGMDASNVSFLPSDDGRLDLAPVYDMLPMAYAPVAGEVPEREFAVPLPDPGHADAWSAAGAIASGYWRAVARDERVSRPFQAIAEEIAAAIEAALTRFEAN